MALSGGTVTVDEDGTRTGSGLALALYDAELVASEIDPDTLSDEAKANAHMLFARANYPSSINYAVTVLSLTPAEKATAEAEYLTEVHRPAMVEAMEKLAARAVGLGAAIVGYFAANADVRVTAGSLDAGSPSITRVLAGALE